MAPSLADRSNSLALAAAMSRHPAAGVRGASTSPAEAPSFATVAALLTGPWRVNDPVAFAAAMRAAPLVAGYPVVDLCACARQPTVGLDPLSAAVAGHLESAVGAAAERSALTVRWVAAVGGRYLFVEAAARAPADEQGPELLLLAHLVESAQAELPGTGMAPLDDDSWLVVVVGDGRGGVTGIGRAPLPRDLGSGFGPARADQRASRPPARLGLAVLRERLVGPARVAEGLETAGDGAMNEAVVLPFRR
ncbi:MAG TPA: hypothetical protein VJS45_11460 [Acidimicrobiia bacterium]|nr:hypothetical protein [Acidimicrobiia bacterium]